MAYVSIKTKKRVNKTVTLKKKSVSAARKRFSLSANGLVMATQSGKRHGMRKQSKRQLNNNTGTIALAKKIGKVVFDRFLNM